MIPTHTPRPGFLSVLLFAFILWLPFPADAQGWREKEMEVKVLIENKHEADILHSLQLNGDASLQAGYGTMYVIPAELEKLKASGLKFEVIKNDLNEFYGNFWMQEAEKYHSYDEIIKLMDSLTSAFPGICRKISFGKSVQNRQLVCLKISDNADKDENEPEVLFDGGIHGDEVGGAENTIRFARYICTSYGKNPELTDLINNREIWIYCMVNPDGRVNVSRYNANQVDLNRDLGYMWNGEGSSKATYSQPESKAIRECNYSNKFVIHLNYHSGIECVLFPWCHRAAKAPDYNSFNYLAGLYSSNSKYASLKYLQSNADYATTGELDDCSYGVTGSMGMVVELSTNKQPSGNDITRYYENNVPAMIAMLKYAGYGIEGVVRDSVTGTPVPAVLFINNYYPVYNDPEVGDYHRFLQAGTYSLRVVANGYRSKLIPQVSVTAQHSTVTDILLAPLKGHYGYKVASAAIPGNNASDEGFTPAALGPPDNINYSLGKSGTIIIDMQRALVDVPGKDIRIHEGDNSAEGITCYAGGSMDGPWKLLGTGKGTTDVDLSAGGLSSAQFIRIVDDGDGTANAADAGFDLDGIEVLNPQVTGIPVTHSGAGLVIYPNPADGDVQLEYMLIDPCSVRISLYNALGEKMLVRTEQRNNPGNYFLKLPTAGLAPGVYTILLETGGTSAPVCRKLIRM